MDSLSLETKTTRPMIVRVEDIYNIRQTYDEFVDGAPKPVFVVTFTDGSYFRFIGRVRDITKELSKHRHVIDGTYKGSI
jgi:hypothetical protein